MTAMVETVARLINSTWNEQGEVPFPLYQKEAEALARAAIAAMREPSQAMLEAGANQYVGPSTMEHVGPVAALASYRAMIDAASEEGR